MKISKTRVGIAVATVALAVGCVAGAGCAAQQPEPSNAVAGHRNHAEAHAGTAPEICRSHGI